MRSKTDAKIINERDSSMRRIREGSVISISAGRCEMTFDGITTVKGVEILGSIGFVSVGDTLLTDTIDETVVAYARSVNSTTSRGSSSPSEVTGVHSMDYHSDEEEWFRERFGRIALFSTALSLYDADDSGMATAIAAAVSGDTIRIPPCTLSGNYVIPAGVTVVGKSIEDCVFSGQVSLSNGSTLENISIIRSGGLISAISGVTTALGCVTATMRNVKVAVSNSVGPAYAVHISSGGDISAHNAELLAEIGSVGYAVCVSSGDFYHYGGRAIGTIPLLPYWS